MKNILYTIILSFLFSSSVFAEWTLITEFEEGNGFVDFDTVERNNGKVYIWSLIDSKIKDEWDALSATSLLEFDCNTPKRHRIISMNTYSGNMGEGEIVDSTSMEFAWEYPAPNSTYSTLTNNLCKP